MQMKKLEEVYTNRELSWLQFNERVLNEAGNPRVPLAERLTFASIYQTNLDEFFMVRVGSLMMQMNSKEKIFENKTKMSSEEQVSAILDRVCELEKKKARIYEQLMGELEPKGVRIINFNKLSKDEGDLLEAYFDAHIAPFLSPMIIGKQQPFPFLANKQLYAVVLLTTQKGKKKTGIVPCSNSVFKRLIEIPTRPGTFMLSEELILHFVSKLYPKYVIREKSIMRVTRNADIDAQSMYDEDMDYRNMMEELIKKRVRLDPVRVELSRKINRKAIDELSSFLEIGKKHFISVKTPLDMSFVFQLQHYLRDKQELFFEKRTPRDTPELSLKESILGQVEKKDVLLSYPFESMKPFIKMLNDAAEDPDVVSIKMTLYRVADKSQIIDALIEAAENGKEVIVLVELRARFDEANNIEMSHRLEDAGCQILYGLGDYKVHSKLCLITKKKGDGFEYITQIGTGNYNEKTSRLYTDLSLITANQEIGADASRVFMALQRGETVSDGDVKHLLVAPKCLQNKIVDMIDEQDPDVVSIKMTLYRVADKSQIIDALIEAAENGKEVIVLVELRARFDEANNIEMSHRLEDAGCQILYGLGDYKVHSKLCLITKKKGDGFEYITQIGTGNYNEKTSRLYTDLSLITANQEIGADASRVFMALQRGETVSDGDVKHLLVAPKCLQNKIVDMIDEQIANKNAGKPAYIGVKINSLTDKVLIDKLIDASQAGVKVELIVRGICCVKPQVENATENITVISVVGRYLEHSRIYRFGVGDDEKIYIASADFMTRNTVRRVEVATPVYDAHAKDKIRHIFDTIMTDDEKGKELCADGEYVDRKINSTPIDSQEQFFEEAYKNADKSADNQ